MHQLLKPQGKLIGLLFNRSFEVSPPFGGTKAEYEQLFRGAFTWKQLETAMRSIPARQGSELFLDLTKNENVQVNRYQLVGMTCNSCREKVEQRCNQISGVVNAQISSDFKTLLLVTTHPLSIQELQTVVSADEAYELSPID